MLPMDEHSPCPDKVASQFVGASGAAKISAAMRGAGLEIAFDLRQRHAAGILGKAVWCRPGSPRPGVQIDHILAEAKENLRRLSADAPLDVGLAGKGALQLPSQIPEILDIDPSVNKL